MIMPVIAGAITTVRNRKLRSSWFRVYFTRAFSADDKNASRQIGQSAAAHRLAAGMHTLTGTTIHHIHRDKQVNFGAGCAPLPLGCSDAMLGMMRALPSPSPDLLEQRLMSSSN
jgi:hypothetical protein